LQLTSCRVHEVGKIYTQTIPLGVSQIYKIAFKFSLKTPIHETAVGFFILN